MTQLKFVYNKKSDKDYIKIKYLLGLIYYKEDLKTFSKEIRFLGLPFFKRKINNGREKFYLFGLMVFSLNSKYALYEEIIKRIGKQYANVYINFNRSGETYLYLSYLKPEESSVFIATLKYHIDLCKMMHPNIECVYMPELPRLRGFSAAYKENYKFCTFYNVMPLNHFMGLENNLRKGLDVHYCKELCRAMGVEYSTCAKFPTISENAKNSALDKARKISLNLDNFVFLCPESWSNDDPSDGFWENIIEKFYKEGVDVFLNVMQLNPKYGTAKTCFLTFEEAYYLASLSKEIIGLRSGFIEPLTSIKNVPITCYYTNFKARGILKALDVETVLKGFSLKELPNIDSKLIKEEIVV